MKAVALILACAASVSAFVPPTAGTARTSVVTEAKRDVSAVLGGVGVQAPFPGVFDPWGLGSSEEVSDETLRWYRAAEVKHSRVAMLAYTGFLVHSNSITFPGFLSIPLGVKFADLSGGWPFDAIAKVPEVGIAQMLFVIGFLEIRAEAQKPHVTKGGPLPNAFPWNYAGPKKDLVVSMEAQNKELANGRLAMLGTASLLAAHMIPGSIPWIGFLPAGNQ